MARSKMLKVEMSENTKPKVALYARVSTDFQAEEGYSIDVQKERLSSYVKGAIENPESVSFYVDDGFSGGDLNRPKMQCLIQDILDGNITHVIVYKLDRLSRSQKDTLYLIEDVFIPHNVAFISIQESFNTATPFGRAVIGILAVFAQLERENIFERTRNGMTKRVEAGYWMGGATIPFGYDYDKNLGTLVPNDKAEIVKQVYELYLEGNSEGMIAKKFGFKYEQSVRQMLCKKTYTGVTVYNGVEYQGRHQPLISMETYEKVCKELKRRGEKKYSSTSDHLLTGLVVCGVCGAKMRYIAWNKKRTFYRFMCYSQQKSKAYLIKDPDCDNFRPSAEDIESVVISDIMRMSSVQIGEEKQNDTKKETVIDTLKNQLRISETKIKRLYSLYSNDGNEYLLESIEELKKQIKDIKERISEEEEKINDMLSATDAQRTLRNLQDMWDLMTVKERRLAISSIVESIVVTRQNITINYKL